MKLTKSQIKFLEQQNISTDQVFDATGLSRTEYSEQMRAGGFRVATGVTRCGYGNHSLRSRAGHCVMCNPANSEFQKRYEISGDLYVFYSPSRRLVKVGVAGDAEERVISANKQAYGGIKDWKLKLSVRVKTLDKQKKLFTTHCLGTKDKGIL